MSIQINAIIRTVLLVIILIISERTFAQSNNNSYVFDGESGYTGILDTEELVANPNKEAYQYFDNASA